jgi:hypothetical protein
MKYSEDALEVGFKNQDIELIAPIAFSLFMSYSVLGLYYKIVDKAPAVIDLIERTGRESDFFAGFMNPYSTLCAIYGLSVAYLGNFTEGKIFLEKGLGTASEINDLRTLGFVETFYGFFFSIKGDWKPTVAHLQDGIKYLEKVKWLMGLAWEDIGEHGTTPNRHVRRVYPQRNGDLS